MPRLRQTHQTHDASASFISLHIHITPCDHTTHVTPLPLKKQKKKKKKKKKKKEKEKELFAKTFLLVAVQGFSVNII